MIGIKSRKNSNCTHGIVSSRLYNERNFYRSFKKDLRSAKQQVIIESQFMSETRTKELVPIFKKLKKRGVKVIVYTRNPYQHDYLLRQQGFIAFKALKKAKVKVKLCKDMRHRKLAVIDKSILWEGSLNILSQSHSKEIMRRSDSSELASDMLRFTGLNRRFC